MSADKKANPRDEKELSKFLDKVNEMESLMKGMTSGEKETEAKAMERADEIIAKFEEKVKDKQDEEDSIARTGVNRTVINKDAYKNDEDVSQGGVVKDHVDQAGFMQALEDDARERHERRQQATKEANELKEKGNAHFKNGEYEKAIELYAEGLTKIKDLLPLWTNKAMANNKLGRFEEALGDCDWALRVDEKSSKAYLQQGKAYLCLEQFDKARASYNQILECDKNLKKQVDNYLHEVDLAEQSKKDNEAAKKLFEDQNVEALSLFQLIDKVKTPQPRVEYYLGGLQLLHSALRTEQDRLLFRTGHGFTLHEFDMIERSFKRVAKTKTTDLDICVVLYRLYEKACAGLETSQTLLFKNESFTSQTMMILESKVEKLELVQKTVFQFLMTCCKDDFGLKLVLGMMDGERFAKCLFQHCVATKSTSTVALQLLEILTKETKFNIRLRSMHDVVDPLIVSMETSNSKRQLSIMTSFVRMTSDVQFRRHFNDSPSVWKTCTNLLRKFENVDVMNLLFVFLLNITVEKSENAAKFSKEIIAILMTKINKSEFGKGIVGLVSHILPKYEVSKESVTLEFVELCVELCTSDDVEILKYSTRCIACVSKDTKFTSIILESNGFENLVKLTSTKSDDVIANSVICITDLLEKQETKSHMKILKKVDFVKTLLVLVRDTLNETVKKNSAILLAKLAQADPVYLERLRELHGVEILLQTVSPDSL